MAVTLALILLASLASRAMVARHADESFDVQGHLYFSKVLREQRGGPFGDITLQVVGASSYSQPFMWHWLVGFLDPRGLRRHQAWLNGVVDAIYAVLAYLLMLRAGCDNRVALFAIALYLLTPMWFSSLAIGPRIAGFTPRLSSEVATNLFFVVTLLPVDLPWPIVATLAVALATFVLSSSKFGVQALLFLTPLVSLLAQQWMPLAAMLVAVATTVVASRGRAIKQFKAQASHLAWYFRENLQGRMHVSKRNSLRALFKRSESSTAEYFAKLVYRALSENSYTSVLLKSPLLLFAVLPWTSSLRLVADDRTPVLMAPVLAAVLLYFVVNLRPLLFLGEAERYLNHVAFFVALAAAQHATASDSEWVLWALLAYGFTYLLLEGFALTKLKPAQFKERQIQDAFVIEDLRLLLEPTVVLCYPYHAGAGVYRIMSETQHRVVFCFGTSAAFSSRFNSEYAADYPYVRLERLDEMADDFGIGYIVLDRRQLQLRSLANWRPSARWTPRAVGGQVYAVYSRSVALGR